jgi:hypothetical protein
MVHYRYRETVYHIAVLQTAAGVDEMSVTVDGVEQPDKAIPLIDDRQEHSVEVRIEAAEMHDPLEAVVITDAEKPGHVH